MSLTFDILDLSEEEVEALTTVQQKLLRTAQKSKNELEHQLELDKQTFFDIVVNDNMLNSSLYDDKCAALDEEYEREVEILREQLIFNLALNEPTTDEELGDDGGDEGAGYIVDYSLSYLERYIIVRDYYLAIEDDDERMALYSADTVAMAYLGSYYNTLYNILATYSG
ncbi:MAG: hypothetical protein LUF82_03275 [Clostridia bacterium]|nr:hypothetical protein [Clostridia bacterium]